MTNQTTITTRVRGFAPWTPQERRLAIEELGRGKLRKLTGGDE